jgi:uncharacterized membrane protein
MAALSNPKRIFVTGLIVVLPLLITWWLLALLFHTLDGLVAPLIEALVKRPLPGLGLLLTLLAIFLVGLLASNIIGARIVRAFERFLLRVPLVRAIFGPAKQLFHGLGGDDTADREVVALEFPRPGLYMIGFVTGRSAQGVTVFLPTAPNPTSGFLVICEARQVTPLSLPFDEAMQMIVSGGFVGPGAGVLGDKMTSLAPPLGAR